MRNNYNAMVKPAGSRVMTNSGVLTLRFYGQHGANQGESWYLSMEDFYSRTTTYYNFFTVAQP